MSEIPTSATSARPLRLASPRRVSRKRTQNDLSFRRVLDLLPAAVYTTDAAGRITYYNEAAVALWGCRPELGKSEWCGSWKLFWPDGRAMAHGDCPMATAIKERRAIRGIEAIAERPDGTRVSFMPYPVPIFDASGTVVGGVNMLMDVSDRQRADELAQRLAAIVASSDDAIVSKNLDGVIQSWNEGAKRLFGYTAEEAIGKPVTMLIPSDRIDEEPTILARIRRGERIEHYETVRRRKDGSLIDISLTVSPVRDGEGRIIGASKIARDITERRRAQDQQRLLLREMDHRVKNLFALAQSVVALSARSAKTPRDLASDIQERLGALARAHALTISPLPGSAGQTDQPATLQALIDTIVSPYEDGSGDQPRVVVSGPDIALSKNSLTSLALLLHESATNAAKYGALSTPAGRIEIRCFEDDNAFVLQWTESGGPLIEGKAGAEGFGALITHAAAGQLGGDIVRDWKPEGLTFRLSMDRSRLNN
jgi:PAS domain S-box-containing protein